MPLRSSPRLSLGIALLAFGVAVASSPHAAAQPIEVDLIDTTDACITPPVGITIGEAGLPPVEIAIGHRFTVEAEGSWLPEDLTVCVSTPGTHHTHQFTLRLDEAGEPGEEIYFFHPLVPTAPELVTAPANKRPALLEFGQAYWIVAESAFTSSSWWLPTAPSVTGLRATSLDGGPYEIETAPLPQMRLHAVPEASSGAGFAAAAFAAALLRRRRARTRQAAACAAVMLASPAIAAQQVLDFTELGVYTTDTFALCGAGASTDAGAALTLSSAGLGVDGLLGTNAAQVDGSETLSFSFAPPGATQISYQVSAAGNQNGSGAFGEAFVEAFEYVEGELPVSLGAQAVSGTGTKDVSALFAGARISQVRITASGDGHRISSLVFQQAAGAPIITLFDGLGTFTASSYERCGMTITGSSTLSFGSVGLGAVDFVYPSALNGAEWLEFGFEPPREQVVYFNGAIAELNGNGLAAQAFVQAFDAQGASLGAVAVSGEEGIDVTDLFGGVPISAFRVTANADAQAIEGLFYAPEPDAAPLAGLLALGALSAVAARRRRQAAGLGLAIGLALAPSAARADYALEAVVRTGDVIDGRTLTELHRPAIDASGEIYFRADFDGGSGIFTSEALLVETGQSIGGETLVTLGDPGVGPQGEVAFRGTFDFGSTTGLFTPTQLLIEEGDMIGGHTVSNVSFGPSVGATGTPLFKIFTTNGDEAMVTPAGIQLIEGQTIEGRTIQAITSGVDPDPIDAAGTIATVARYDLSGAEAIFTQSAVLVDEGDSIDGLVIQELLNNVDRNEAGTIAFTASFAGGNGIFTQDALLVRSDDMIDGLRMLSLFPPAINEAGLVAFYAGYQLPNNAPGAGIFTQHEAVVRSFETTIGGDVVSGPENDRPALNDAGQIAFWALFSSAGYSAIVRATPVPEPGAAAGAWAALLVLAGAHRVLRGRARVVARASVVGVAFPLATIAPAQNLLSNGDFASDLAGWENGAAFIASEWSSADAQGELDSGSALVTNTSPSSGGGGNGIRRCLPIEPGATYSLSGCVFIPFGQANTGHGTLQPQFFSELGCTGSVFGVGGTDFVTAVNTWDCRENPAVMAPFEARSARIIAFVSKAQPNGSLSMRFDDVAFVPEPGAVEGAALAMLTAYVRGSRRRAR